MIGWRHWCRLCGSCEQTERINSLEIDNIVTQLFEIPSETSSICIDCKSYVNDFNEFLSKSRAVNEMFDELELKDGDDGYAIQLRQLFNLSMPTIEVVEATGEDVDVTGEDVNATGEDIELIESLAEIEAFRIDDDDEPEEVEYLEDNEVEQEQELEQELEQDDLSQDFSGPDQELFIKDEDVQIVDDEWFDGITVEEPASLEMDSFDMSEYFDFTCHLCNENFPKMCFLSIHTRTLHKCQPRVECVCGNYVGSVNALELHFKDHVMPRPQRKPSDEPIEKKKFQCECGKSFKEARHLAVHANSHLPDSLKFVHHCTFCSKKYSSVFSLRHHIKHVHVNAPTFECQHCDKMFSRKANLDSHVNHVHTSERAHQCDECGLKVKTKNILRVHKKIHSTDPNDLLACEFCDRKFKTKNQLTNHKICHSLEKRYKCMYCPAEYKRSKELPCHIASSHTGVSRYSCLWCPKTFFNNSNFRKHKLKMHPKETQDSQDVKQSELILS